MADPARESGFSGSDAQDRLGDQRLHDFDLGPVPAERLRVLDRECGGFIRQRRAGRSSLQQCLDRTATQGDGRLPCRARPWRRGTGRLPSSRGKRRPRWGSRWRCGCGTSGSSALPGVRRDSDLGHQLVRAEHGGAHQPGGEEVARPPAAPGGLDARSSATRAGARSEALTATQPQLTQRLASASTAARSRVATSSPSRVRCHGRAGPGHGPGGPGQRPGVHRHRALVLLGRDGAPSERSPGEQGPSICFGRAPRGQGLDHRGRPRDRVPAGVHPGQVGGLRVRVDGDEPARGAQPAPGVPEVRALADGHQNLVGLQGAQGGRIRSSAGSGPRRRTPRCSARARAPRPRRPRARRLAGPQRRQQLGCPPPAPGRCPRGRRASPSRASRQAMPTRPAPRRRGGDRPRPRPRCRRR